MRPLGACGPRHLELVAGTEVEGKPPVPVTGLLADDVLVVVGAHLLRRGFPPRAVRDWLEEQA